MKVLLLNSGVGSRMGNLTKQCPKCMCPIGGGYTILSRQLIQIAQAGIQEAVITVGPFAGQLKEYVEGLNLPVHITYVPNTLYHETNYIYSMYLAADHLTDDILLLHGDLVLDSSVISDLIASKNSVVAVDSTLPLPDKDFKARVQDGRVTAIGIEFFGPDCITSQPAYYFYREDFAAWMKAIGEFCQNGQRKVYAENAFNAQNGSIPLYPLELYGRLCNEIDNLQDLETVSRRFMHTLREGVIDV
jgi:phosphoenolpyruvate phosphomutase